LRSSRFRIRQIPDGEMLTSWYRFRYKSGGDSERLEGVAEAPDGLPVVAVYSVEYQSIELLPGD
jgi:hypothetical protein